MKIVQAGCFGSRNYGDQVSAQIVRRSFENMTAKFFIVGSGAERLSKRAHPGLPYFSAGETPKLRRLLAKANCVIHGPGTVVGSMALKSTPAVLTSKRPVIVWGVGSGLVKPNSIGAKLVARAYFVGARDHASARAMSIASDNVKVIPDPMLLEGKPQKRSGPNLVCLTWGLTKAREEVQTRVFRAVREAMEKIGGSWRFLPSAWDGSEIGTFDDDRLIAKWMGFSPVDIITPRSFADVTKRLRKAPLLLTSRLHPGVVAIASDVPTVTFGLPKILKLLTTLGCPERHAGGYGGLTSARILQALESPMLTSEQTADLRHEAWQWSESLPALVARAIG